MTRQKMSITFIKVKTLIGLSALWAIVISSSLLSSVEVQISHLSQPSVFRNSSSNGLHAPQHISPVLNSSDTGRKKHHLIIHVGPEKTASTSLQKAFYNFATNKRAFDRDNYVYMGRYTTLRPLQEVLLYCPGKMKENPEHKCYKRFLRLVQDERWRDKNVLLSEEVYCKAIWDVETIPIVQQYFLPLLQEQWDIEVVAIYRRFHDWLVSARKQRDAELSIRQLWPQEGGEPLDSWKEIMLLRKHERYGLRSHYLPDGLAQWYDLNVSVTVLNLHQSNITERFVCDFLPNATNTCQFYRSQRRERTANVRSGLEYFFDNIVYAAAAKGIFDTTSWRRHDIVKNLTLSYRSIPDLPLICPSSDDLEDLLQESIRWEQYYAPDHSDIESLKMSFQELDQAKQFCRVDTDLLLEGVSEWSEVLQKLISMQVLDPNDTYSDIK